MKKIYLEVNTTTGAVRVNGDSLPAGGLQLVHGDTVLLAVAFRESIPESISGDTAETAMDLSDGGAPLGLRFTCDEARLEAADLLTFQDDYNAGHWAEEDLAAGVVTWLVDFGASAIGTALGTEESISVYGEFTLLTADGYPQTLVQFPITIYAQIDNGAVGTPPPSSPTNQTAAAALTTYALVPDSLAVSATGTLASANRRRIYFVDTTGGNITLTLPALSGIDANYRPVIVKTVAANTLTIQRAGADTLNGGTDMTIVSQYGAVELIPHVAGTNWIAATAITP